MAATSTQSARFRAPAVMASSQSTSRGAVISARNCGRCLIKQVPGWCVASSSARSSIGLYSTRLDGSIPHEADTTTLGCASSMRTASSLGAKPPKTTEWTAPSLAQASIAMTPGISGMYSTTRSPFSTPNRAMPCECRDLLQQLPVGVPLHGLGHRAVVDQRGAVPASRRDVAVDCVEAGVERRVGIPSVDRCTGVVQHAVRRLDPIDEYRLLAPELLRVLNAVSVGPTIGLLVHWNSSASDDGTVRGRGRLGHARGPGRWPPPSPGRQAPARRRSAGEPQMKPSACAAARLSAGLLLPPHQIGMGAAGRGRMPARSTRWNLPV